MTANTSTYEHVTEFAPWNTVFDFLVQKRDNSANKLSSDLVLVNKVESSWNLADFYFCMFLFAFSDLTVQNVQ